LREIKGRCSELEAGTQAEGTGRDERESNMKSVS
jgi:hypothetical protein